MNTLNDEESQLEAFKQGKYEIQHNEATKGEIEPADSSLICDPTLLDIHTSISIEWSIGDVLTIRPDLTLEQAFFVLKTAEHRHDANTGFTWDFLEDCAQTLYPL